MTKNLLTDIWRDFDIIPEKIFFWEQGTLKLWCKMVSNEIRLTYQHLTDQQTSEILAPPDEASWSRFALKKNFSRLRLSPVFPDRPIVVQTRAPFNLIRGAAAKVYIRLPMWVKIELLEASKNFTLIELPTVILSNTWLGDFFTGELCYWISTSVSREIIKDAARPFLCLCPIEFFNKSNDDLLVEKICLRVGGFSLFHDRDQLWSDEIKVIFKGNDKTSQIIHTGKAAKEALAAKLISSPREADKKSFTAKTFISIKDLAMFQNFIN